MDTGAKIQHLYVEGDGAQIWTQADWLWTPHA